MRPALAIPAPAGNKALIERSVEQMYRGLEWYALGRLWNYADAQDAVQTTALRAIERADTLRAADSATAFIWAIMRSVVGQAVTDKIEEREHAAVAIDAIPGAIAQKLVMFTDRSEGPQEQAIRVERGRKQDDVLLRANRYAHLTRNELTILELNRSGHDCNEVMTMTGLTHTQYRLSRTKGKHKLECYMQKHEREWN